MRKIWAAVCVVVMAAALWAAPRVPAPSGELSDHWLKIVFGVDGKSATWDGRLEVEGGQVLDMVAWGLEARDSIDPQQAAWTIKSGLDWSGSGGDSFAEPIRGILVQIRGGAPTSLRIRTEQGSFEVRHSALVPGRPSEFLEGRARVELLGTEVPAVIRKGVRPPHVQPTTNDLAPKGKGSDPFSDSLSQTEDDFAAVAITPDGHRHVGWIAYDDAKKRDRLLVRDVDAPGASPEPIADFREFASLHLVTIDGTLHAAFCSPGTTGDWDVYWTRRGGAGWEPLQRLTTTSGTDFHLAAAKGPDGSLWLAWQSFRNGHGDIHARRWTPAGWSDEVLVAGTPANEWEPAIDVDAKGTAWVGYDTYEHGNYDVYLVPLIPGGRSIAVGARIPVATSEDFEAHASVRVDGEGRVWVAYDAAGPNWGKDFARGETMRNGLYAEPLHATRRLELVCIDHGRLHRPQAALPQRLGPRRASRVLHRGLGEQVRFYDLPQLGLDGHGRLWLFFRLCRQGYTGHPRRGGCWDIFATTFTERGWLEPIQLPRSEGRQNQRLAFTPGADGRLVCAWSDGNHHVNRRYTVHFGELPPVTEAARPIPLEPFEPSRPAAPELVAPDPWTLRRGEEEYRVYFGDLHRHTSISLCTPTIDGCLVDAHRYALDAAQLDFLAVTDHTRDTDPFPWWRTQKAADLFHVPGRYVPIYGYERSNGAAGGGHRNVFFLERGHEVNRSDAYYADMRLPNPGTDPDKTLYPWLRERPGSFTAAHTPGFVRGRNRGTWTFNDPQVEPVAEIFQAYRRSYERPDPKGEAGVGGVGLEASLWYALAQGYRLGFIASSDHHSTHLSYACVWAREKTRSAIFEGIHARRTYAATDRIVLDVRIAKAIMGEEAQLGKEAPVLHIRARGTAPFDEVQIIRQGAVAKVIQPNQAEIDIEWTDAEPPAGTSYYYVRLHQQDDNFAWGSPIWVRRN